MDLYYNKEITHLTVSHMLDIPNGKEMFIPPVYFLFTDQAIPENALAFAQEIRFDK